MRLGVGEWLDLPVIVLLLILFAYGLYGIIKKKKLYYLALIGLALAAMIIIDPGHYFFHLTDKTRLGNAQARTALNDLYIAQENYFEVQRIYSKEINNLIRYGFNKKDHPNVNVILVEADDRKWIAKAKHRDSDKEYTCSSEKGIYR